MQLLFFSALALAIQVTASASLIVMQSQLVTGIHRCGLQPQAPDGVAAAGCRAGIGPPRAATSAQRVQRTVHEHVPHSSSEEVPAVHVHVRSRNPLRHCTSEIHVQLDMSEQV